FSNLRIPPFPVVRCGPRRVGEAGYRANSQPCKQENYIFVKFFLEPQKSAVFRKNKLGNSGRISQIITKDSPRFDILPFYGHF
ncbi:MAG: hypothetical protein COB54_08745, partial [Alphaproteobacteria bacterium]